LTVKANFITVQPEENGNNWDCYLAHSQVFMAIFPRVRARRALQPCCNCVSSPLPSG